MVASKWPVTIVTCFYKIPGNTKRSLKQYRDWMANFFEIRTPKVIFTDRETYRDFFTSRTAGNVRYVFVDWQKFLCWGLYDKFVESADDEAKWRLNMLWNEKIHFVRRAIGLNLYGSEFFVWTDIGCFRDSRYNRFYRNWPSIRRLRSIGAAKVTLLLISPFEDKHKHAQADGLPPSVGQQAEAPGTVGGGIMSGHSKAWLRWHDRYYKTLMRSVDAGRPLGSEQPFLSATYLLYPQLVNLVAIRHSPFCPNPWFYLQPYLQGLPAPRLTFWEQYWGTGLKARQVGN